MDTKSVAPSDLWAIAFTARLLELQPDLGLARVILVCAEMFSEVGEVDPLEAAESYALCACGRAIPEDAVASRIQKEARHLGGLQVL
jgi:hypothetical protein